MPVKRLHSLIMSMPRASLLALFSKQTGDLVHFLHFIEQYWLVTPVDSILLHVMQHNCIVIYMQEVQQI